MQIPILHDGVDHDGNIVVLHTHFEQRVDIRMVQASQQRSRLKELGDFVAMAVLLLEAWRGRK